MRRALGDLPFAGPSLTTSAACASGLSAIAQGITLLESGDADLVVAGGYDAISEFPYGGFNSLRLVAEGAIAPFTRDRTGMKIGEGYALVVLERSEDASARGATVVARIVGYGETSDAHHLTQPDPTGAGAARAVRAALARGGTAPGEIGLLSAHATATPNNDAAEHAAFTAVFGAARPPIVAFKSHLGHTLGGAGGRRTGARCDGTRGGRARRPAPTSRRPISNSMIWPWSPRRRFRSPSPAPRRSRSASAAPTQAW